MELCNYDIIAFPGKQSNDAAPCLMEMEHYCEMDTSNLLLA